MALLSVVAGRFSGTYDPPGATAAADLGVMEKGWEISCQVAKEMISETDKFGLMTVTGIYRGISDVTIQVNAVEWTQGLLNAAFPYAPLLVSGATYLGPGVIARDDNDVAGVLILSSTAGTPAAARPASMTASLTILHENSPVTWALNSTVRKLPLKLRVYPFDDGGVTKFFTAT
jgi:hypothetical protein